MLRIPDNKNSAYFWAFAGTAILVLLRLMVWDIAGDRAPYAFFFIIVTAVGIMGGFWPGLLATILGGLSAQYFLVAPNFQFSANAGDYIILAAFITVGTIISYLCEIFRQRSEQVENILKTTLDAVVVTDERGLIKYWNRRAEKTFGWSEGEALGQRMTDLIITPAAKETYREDIQSLYNADTESVQPRMVEITAVNRQGSAFPIELAVVAQKIHRSLSFTSFIKDITDRKAAENLLKSNYEELDKRVKERTLELDQSRAFLRTIIDTVADPIFVKDRNHCWIEGNKAFWDLLGSEGDLKGKTDYDLFPKEQADKFWQGDERVFGGEMFDEEEVLRNAKGEDLVISTKKVSFKLANGQQGIVGVIRDVTKEKRIEEELRHHRDNLQEMVTLQTRDLIREKERAEAANIAKTEFLANMSHEIRTPMNVIMGISEILLNGQPLTPKQKEFLTVLKTSSHSLLSLINDLLDITKIEARKIDLEKRDFSFVTMLSEVLTMLEGILQEKGISFDYKISPGAEKTYRGDAARIQQMIVNLCSNAIKFTERGGIFIEIRSEPGIMSEHENVWIAVTDTGIGIADDKQEAIFEKFVQADNSISRRYGGTGLGLTITKTLVETMGGDIQLSSKLGEGSTFTLHIPLEISSIKEISARTRTEFASSPALKSNQKILVVEDHMPNLMVVTSYLDQFGYEYDAVMTGAEAVEKAKAMTYAVILLDVQMPGLSGLEVTDQIRTWEEANGRKGVPIIGMTAHALTEDKERCLAAGMNDYLSKPFDPLKLERMLLQYSKST
jgi:PAS domain S-box-containing protein